MFKNKEGKVRSGWKIAAVLAIGLGLATIISTIIGIAVSAKLLASGDIGTDMDAYLQRSQEIVLGLTPVFMFIQEIILIATPLLAWKLAIKRPFTNMGLTPLKTDAKDFITGLVFGIVSITIVFLALILSGNANVETWVPHFSSAQLLYLVLFILVGFAEEILGRGYIMSVLRQTKSKPAIVIVSAIIFALMHSSNQGIGLLPYINLALVGILFSYMFLKSGNIWMCIGYHITWNYLQGYVFGFNVSGTVSDGLLSTTYKTNNIFNGGAFGPEGGLFVTAVIFASFLFVKYYYRNKQFDFLSMDEVETIPSELSSDDIDSRII